ncbi:MAG TPA: plastocyanin/azurin family copper-binding protein [Chloroflexota bacterium]|nr:plastocyanin/azurin family copper-binding protein [Chloroflexota bacterium]
MKRALRILLYTAILLLPLGLVASHVTGSASAKGAPACSKKHLNTKNCTIKQTKSFTFSPQFIQVKAGVTVTWVNTAPFAHTTTSDPGDADSWDSGSMGPHATFSHTFNVTGTMGYHCSFHGSPGHGMYGTITVTP